MTDPTEAWHMTWLRKVNMGDFVLLIPWCSVSASNFLDTGLIEMELAGWLDPGFFMGVFLLLVRLLLVLFAVFVIAFVARLTLLNCSYH